jgi:hypothetical protein
MLNFILFETSRVEIDEFIEIRTIINKTFVSVNIVGTQDFWTLKSRNLDRQASKIKKGVNFQDGVHNEFALLNLKTHFFLNLEGISFI